MRADDAAVVTHRLFAAFPESTTLKRQGQLKGTRDEYERFFRDFSRETGDAIVTKAVLIYEWLPKIKHLAMVARDVAGDGSFARLKERLLAAGKWATTQTFRTRDGMTLRDFFVGELEIARADLKRLKDTDGEADLATRAAALEALLSELDEFGGHRDRGDPVQAALGLPADVGEAAE